ncbi:MAG: chorismate synthase, partial [Pygmaiobacter sp.]
MKNTIGTAVAVTLFGESHGTMIGAVLDGIAPGVGLDLDFMRAQLALRRPQGTLATARVEQDEFSIVSGVVQGVCTGTPITILIPNTQQESRDYTALSNEPRPSHADYAATCKYHGFEDARGGGHFSGRITAPLVAAGAVARSILKWHGIVIGTHLSVCAGIADMPLPQELSALEAALCRLETKQFPTLSDAAGDAMKAAIEAARAARDSVGGVLETAVTGLPAGVGEPWFDTVEGVLAKLLFSIPAVKGVEFGSGFALAGLRGSAANDPFYYDETGAVKTRTNHSGGINGGITNGMPLVIRTAVKPTPSIYLPQQTVNLARREEITLAIQGR